MNEMANLSSRRTGLPTFIWFGEIDGQHGPMIKVSNLPGKFAANDCFVFSVDRNPQVMTPSSAKLSSSVIADVKDWIRLNYDDLTLLWKIFETNEPVKERDPTGEMVELDVEDILMQLKKLT
jgi:hypothetical protein